MAMLRRAAAGVDVRLTSEFGAPTDTKEAICFALIGWHTAHGLPGHDTQLHRRSRGARPGRDRARSRHRCGCPSRCEPLRAALRLGRAGA